MICFGLKWYHYYKKINKQLLKYYVSVKHFPTAMFKKQSSHMSRGIFLGFVKPCKTRMGGEIIALLRLIKMREPLVETTISKEFRDLKLWCKFCTILHMKDLWKAIFTLCHAMYAPMMVLWLADMKIPAMDKVRIFWVIIF